jgi:hypothetical protein
MVSRRRCVQRLPTKKQLICASRRQVLPAIINSAKAEHERSGADIFPEQMAVEVHYVSVQKPILWAGRDKSPGEILQLFNFLFLQGGYILADRHDNIMCQYCSEIVLVRAMC